LRADLDDRFANCECTAQTGRNFVPISAILNEKVYRDTIAVCCADGSACAGIPDRAPVCQAIREHKLIPGADVIPTFSPNISSDFVDLIADAPGKPGLTICPKAPYAACMTAPCRITRSGKAECSCPRLRLNFVAARLDETENHAQQTGNRLAAF
jgi:hypothetical protein